MSQKNSVSKLYKELEELTDWFETADSKDVEDALKKYERAQVVISELNEQLKDLRNKITKIDKSFE